MNTFEGIGISALKYAGLNFVLALTNLILYASGPDGGGTGDREEGLYFYTVYWVCLVLGFVIYGLLSVTSGRRKKRTKGLTAIPVLVSSMGITGLLIYSYSRSLYAEDGFLNASGADVLMLNADVLIYLVYFFLLFAVCISVLGMVIRRRFSILGLVLNLVILGLHIFVFREWIGLNAS